MPIILNKALLDIQGDYQFQLVNEKPELNIDKTSVKIYDLVAQSTNQQPIIYQLEKLSLDNIKANWPNPQLTIHHSQINSLNLHSEQQKIVNLADLQLANIRWQQQADQLSLEKISVQDLLINGQQNSLFTLPNLLVSNFSAKPQAQQFHTGKISLEGGHTQISRLKNGELDLQQELNNLATRLQASSSVQQPPAKTTNVKTQLSLGELNVRNFVVDAQDQQQLPVFKQQITINQLTVYPELDLKKPHQLQSDIQLSTGGKINLKGELDESPLMVNTQLKIENLALVPLSSYLQQVALLKLESGLVNVDGHLQFSQQLKNQASFQGNVGVSQFAANDLKLNQRFLAWQDLLAKGLKWQLEPMSINVKEVIANKPFTRLIIAPDRTINFENIVASESKTNTKNNKQTMPLNIDKVQVNDGSMLFADLSLTPQFATGIQALSGQINHISTQTNKLATVQLNGRVDQYGKAVIKGQVNPFKPDQKTNIALKFDNVELTTLTPYSAKFAGYRIDKGKLSLDLNYQVANRQLVASNKLVLNQLSLGERVDSPDAKNLPLRLAVAILKDSHGVIDLNIPITGSLDDPKFKVGPIIWQAVVNVVTKVATAPFRFLASLVNGQDDIDNIPFDLANSQLNEQASTNVQKVADILQKKADLQIEVRGNFNQQQELAALQQAKFKQLWNSNYPNQAISISLLEKLYSQQIGTEALAQQKVLTLKPSAEGQSLTTQTAIYQQTLIDKLVKAQPITEGDLRQLALERAKSIRNQLVEKYQIAANRIFILEPNAVELSQNQQVITNLTLKQD